MNIHLNYGTENTKSKSLHVWDICIIKVLINTFTDGKRFQVHILFRIFHKYVQIAKEVCK